MKKIIALVLTVCMVMSIGITALAAESTQETSLDKLITYYQNDAKELMHWWETVALSSIGQDMTQFSLPQISKDDLKNGITTYVGYIYSMAALGKSPRNAFDGINLLSQLASKQADDGSFGYVNEHIYTILTLENFGQSYNRPTALSWLISKQMDDGAFAYDPQWGGDPDLTGMALSALSMFKDNESANLCVSKALAYLQSVQLKNGGFETWGSINSNTMESVICGLVDIGEDVTSEKWKNIAGVLETYQMANGSFLYLTSDTESNRMSTYQAISALGAIKNGKSMWSTVTSNEVTRAEFIHQLTDVLQIQSTEKKMNFTDVKSNNWYYDDVQAAVRSGWVNGKSTTFFGAEDTITKEQAATILTRALNLTGKIQISDYDAVSDYAKDAVEAVCVNGLFLLKDEKFYPNAILKAEDVLQLLSRIKTLAVQS